MRSKEEVRDEEEEMRALLRVIIDAWTRAVRMRTSLANLFTFLYW